MSSTATKREEAIRRVLAGDGRGVPRLGSAASEAARQEGRPSSPEWTDPTDVTLELAVLRTIRAIRAIRVRFALVLLLFALAAVVMLPYFASYGSPGMPPVIYSAMWALISLAVVVYYGLYRLRRWAYHAAVILGTIGCAACVLLALFLLIFEGNLGGRDLSSLAMSFLAALLLLSPSFVLAWALRTLLSGTASDIFRVQTELDAERRAGKPWIFSWKTAAALAAVVAVNGYLGVTYYRWWIKAPIRMCDRRAHADLLEAAAALERFANEQADLHCHLDEPLRKGLKLEYLVGNYYGWRGTNARCEVLVKVVDDELWSCALRGSRPDPEREGSRYLYRVKISGGKELPATVGPCTGSRYGKPDDKCYTSRAICPRCRICEPKDAVPCGELLHPRTR